MSLSREIAESCGIKPCGDNSCMFGRPGGMATNGGCRCIKNLDGAQMPMSHRTFILRMASAIRFAADLVKDMKSENERLRVELALAGKEGR